jgi:hypothetical protein
VLVLWGGLPSLASPEPSGNLRPRIPNDKFQIPNNSKFQMTGKSLHGTLVFDDWNLFGFWCLMSGASGMTRNASLP